MHKKSVEPGGSFGEGSHIAFDEQSEDGETEKPTITGCLKSLIV